jgi:hypothetical protein
MNAVTCHLCDSPATQTGDADRPDWYRLEYGGIEGTHYHASSRALQRLEQAARESDRRYLGAIADRIAGLSRHYLVAWIDVDDTGGLHIEGKP